MVFGGLSPNIKATLDRNIGLALPFFRNVNGEMHHVPRYKKHPDLKYIFYGNEITDNEKETARKLVVANSINLGSEHGEAIFCKTIEEIPEALE
jgi:hypothetical protein